MPKYDEYDAEQIVGVLEKLCNACHVGVKDGDGRCAICHGLGLIPTNAGHDLIAFLERYTTLEWLPGKQVKGK